MEQALSPHTRRECINAAVGSDNLGNMHDVRPLAHNDASSAKTFGR